MKNKGSIAEYSEDRIQDLLKVYFGYIRECDFINAHDVFTHIVDSPAPRFYVSEPRATVVITKLLQGGDISKMHKTKQEMYREIYSRYIEEKKKHPTLSVAHVVGIVIEQQAPKFYLAPESARVMILKAKKKWFAEKRKRLLR